MSAVTFRAFAADVLAQRAEEGIRGISSETNRETATPISIRSRSRGYGQKSSFHAMVFRARRCPLRARRCSVATSGRMPKAISLVGSRFGKLVIVSFAGRLLKGGRMRRCWVASCDCGNEVVVETGAIRAGNTSSCGCWRTDLIVGRHTTHGHATRTGRPAEYKTWRSMIQRCYTPGYGSYENYGGRGVTVCDAWRWDYAAFLRDVGRKPTPRHSLDRIDPWGNYEPGNVRWATATEQANNKRRHHPRAS